MNLDRALQIDVLRALRDAYPRILNPSTLECADHPDFQSNLFYLSEHGLITGSSVGDGPMGGFILARITAEGLDFLEDDGGVSAAVRTVTVRIDPDHLRSLMAARIEASDMPAEEKSRWAHAIRSLSERALGELATQAVRQLLDQWPAAIRLLQKYLSLD